MFAATEDVPAEFYGSRCLLNASSSQTAQECVPDRLSKSLAISAQMLHVVLYPVTESPRIILHPRMLSISENTQAEVVLTNWTLTDTDGSETAAVLLECPEFAWKEVVLDGLVVDPQSYESAANRSNECTGTCYKLVAAGAGEIPEGAEFNLTLVPQDFFSGAIMCNLVVETSDRSGAMSAVDRFVTTLVVRVEPIASTPSLLLANKSLTVWEDQGILIDGVQAALADTDGSERLCIGVDVGDASTFVSNIRWLRMETGAMLGGADDTIVECTQQGPMFMACFGTAPVAYGALAIEPRSGFSGELQFVVTSFSQEMTSASAANSVWAPDMAPSGQATVRALVRPICHVAIVRMNPSSAVAYPLQNVLFHVSAFTSDVDGSESFQVQISVNSSAVHAVSQQSGNIFEELNDYSRAGVFVLPLLDSDAVFNVTRMVSIVPRAEFVGFFTVNVTVWTRESETGEQTVVSVIASVLVVPVDPVIRPVEMVYGTSNAFVRVPFRRLDKRLEVESREHLVLYVENKTDVADMYAGVTRVSASSVDLGNAAVHVIPYSLRDAISVRPSAFWSGYTHVHMVVSTVAFDFESNHSAYESLGDGVTVVDVSLVFLPLVVTPMLSTVVTGGDDVRVTSKPQSISVAGVAPRDEWGRSTVGGLRTQLMLPPSLVVDAVKPSATLKLVRSVLNGREHEMYETSSTGGASDLGVSLTSWSSSAFSGSLTWRVVVGARDVLSQRSVVRTLMRNWTWWAKQRRARSCSEVGLARSRWRMTRT